MDIEQKYSLELEAEIWRQFRNTSEFAKDCDINFQEALIFTQIRDILDIYKDPIGHKIITPRGEFTCDTYWKFGKELKWDAAKSCMQLTQNMYKDRQYMCVTDHPINPQYILFFSKAI